MEPLKRDKTIMQKTNDGFFDQYPRFFETSETMPYPNRLNNRYKALIERNRTIIKEASILDLASHDGRWSFAALQSGAKHVVGLEGHLELVEDAQKTCQKYGIDKDRVQFIPGDLFETIKDFKKGFFEVIFCFGFFHMQNRHYEMMKQIERLAPKFLILDVWILPFTNDPVTYLIPQVVDENGTARSIPDFDYPPALREKMTTPSIRDGGGIKFGPIDSKANSPEVMLLAYPSQTALEWLLLEAGFGELDYFDWKNAPIENWNDLSDYHTGQRVSLTAKNLRIQKKGP